jgi:hypothetical protein
MFFIFRKKSTSGGKFCKVNHAIKSNIGQKATD